MSGGRTYWWAKDATWLARDGITELGEEHGPAGPLLIDALCGQAKLENDGGRVTSGWRALARAAFLPDGADQARLIVEHAHRIGVLDDLEADDDGRRFSCRVSGWVADQTKGRAAQRQADARVTERAEEERDVPSGAIECHPVTDGDESRSVTDRHVPVGTGQDSTGQEDNSKASSLRSDAARERPKPNEDEPPSDLPEQLRPVAELVRDRLGEVAAAKRAKPVTLLGAGRLVRDHPRHDHPRIVGAFATWWLDGAGAKRRSKDVLSAYRNWVGREDEVAQPLRMIPGGGLFAATGEETAAEYNARQAAKAAAAGAPDLNPAEEPVLLGDWRAAARGDEAAS